MEFINAWHVVAASLHIRLALNSLCVRRSILTGKQGDILLPTQQQWTCQK